ncbi:MAG: sulfatase [Planctomycetota bacterium]
MNLSSPRSTLALAVAVALTACSPPPSAIDPAGPPHIVVVLIDTLRADHTSLHGHSRKTTPHLERIAREGAWMKRHFVNAPWTKPSVASILTGLHPTAHGSRIGQFSDSSRAGRAVEVLDDGHETVVELLRAGGYRTAAHVSNVHLQPKWGYAQGYDDYRFVERANRDNVVDSDEDAIDFVIDQLDASDRPAFVWAHLMAVHEYVAPRRHRVYSVDKKTPIDKNAPGAGRVIGQGSIEMAEAKYDQAIRYSDALVGDLYDRLKRRHPHSILIVTSDHGEEFYDHGGFEHCHTLYNELLRVPLVVAGAGVPAGSEVSGITDSLDLFPTILAFAGLDVEDLPRPGRSLINAAGELAGGKSETFAEQHHRGKLVRFALNSDGTKLIESYEKRLQFTGVERVGPLKDEAWYREAWGPETAAMEFLPTDADREDVRSRVEAYRTATRAHFARTIGDQAYGEVTDEDVDQLRALGYGGER